MQYPCMVQVIWVWLSLLCYLHKDGCDLVLSQQHVHFGIKFMKANWVFIQGQNIHLVIFYSCLSLFHVYFWPNRQLLHIINIFQWLHKFVFLILRMHINIADGVVVFVPDMEVIAASFWVLLRCHQKWKTRSNIWNLLLMKLLLLSSLLFVVALFVIATVVASQSKCIDQTGVWEINGQSKEWYTFVSNNPASLWFDCPSACKRCGPFFDEPILTP